MITFFNNLGKTWVAKIILGALALSMLAFWGLGGLANVSNYDNSVITVGDNSLSPQELLNEFEKARAQMASNMGGVHFSVEQALNNGLLDMVIQNKIGEMAQNQIIKDLNLAASNEAVQKYVEHNPLFQNMLNRFDKNLFYAYLMKNKLTETQLADVLKKQLAFNHIADTVIALSYAPDKMMDIVHTYQDEKRDFDTLTISPENITITQQASDTELQNYFEAYSDQFILPEYRHLQAIVLTPEMMKDFITISDEKINAAYDAEKASYTTPEKRDLYQAFFSTKESAEKFMKSVSVDTFIEKAKTDLNQTDETTHFGQTAKNELMAELQEPIFAASANSLTPIIESTTGWHIFLVKSITPESVPSKDFITKQVKNKIIADESFDKMEEIATQLQDILGAGESLESAATKLNLSLQDIPSTDIVGQSADNTRAALQNGALLQEVFTLNKNEISSLMSHANGYAIAQVIDITPSTMQDFADAKDKVNDLYIADKQVEKYEQVVADVLSQVKNGTSLKELEESPLGNFVYDTYSALPRAFAPSAMRALKKSKYPLNPDLMDGIFTQSAGNEYAVAYPQPNADMKETTILVISTITPAPEFDEKSKMRTAQSLKQTNGKNITADVFDNYIKKMGVNVNTTAIQALFSQYTNQ